MIKVCHITSVHHYKDNRIFFKQCASLVEHGYDVYLVASVAEDFVENGIKVIGIGEFKSRWQRFLLGPWRLLKQVVKIKPAVVQIHDPEVTIIVPILKLLGYSVIYDIHEDNKAFILEKDYLPQVAKLPISLAVSIWEWLVARMSNPIIAEKYYEDRFPHALKVLNYPLPKAADQLSEPSNVVADLVFDKDYQWFIYTGNVTLERGAVENLKILLDSPTTAICYVGRCTADVSNEINNWLNKNNINATRFMLIGLETYIAQSDIEYILRRYDWRAGLALFPHSPFVDRKELTKFFDYAAAGIPTLCSDFPHWKKLADERSLGVPYTLNWQDELTNYYNKSPKMKVPSWSSEERKLLSLYEKLTK